MRNSLYRRSRVTDPQEVTTARKRPERDKSERGDEDRVSALPIVLQLDDADTPSDVIDALALSAFTAGDQPWARSVHLEDVRADAPLTPATARVLRSAVSDGRERRLAAGDG